MKHSCRSNCDEIRFPDFLRTSRHRRPTRSPTISKNVVRPWCGRPSRRIGRTCRSNSGASSGASGRESPPNSRRWGENFERHWVCRSSTNWRGRVSRRSLWCWGSARQHRCQPLQNRCRCASQPKSGAMIRVRVAAGRSLRNAAGREWAANRRRAPLRTDHLRTRNGYFKRWAPAARSARRRGGRR